MKANIAPVRVRTLRCKLLTWRLICSRRVVRDVNPAGRFFADFRRRPTSRSVGRQQKLRDEENALAVLFRSR